MKGESLQFSAELKYILFYIHTYSSCLDDKVLCHLTSSFVCSLYSGFEALTEIQNLLNNNGHAPSIKESLIIDASNRFFTVIPSIHPRVIRDEDDFKSKVHKGVLHILKPVVSFMPFQYRKMVFLLLCLICMY